MLVPVEGSKSFEDTPQDEWISAMRRGDFDHAWRISDQILRRSLKSSDPNWARPRHLQHLWDGTPLAGKRILVRCYHGLGDTIQFIRFAAPLRALARDVAIWCQPELVPLIATAPGVDRVLPLHDGSPAIERDLDIEIMELPHALRITADSLPGRVPYVFPSRAQCGFFEGGGGGGEEEGEEDEEQEEVCPRVGLVWRAGDWDGRRSVPIELLERLGRRMNVRLFALQPAADRRELAILGATDAASADLSQTAAFVARLDLVITVDTMMAHLAGALAVPTWTLLHADCDWRWMTTRCDSPWYPSMRLFRQARSGDWPGVVEAVETALIRVGNGTPGVSAGPQAAE